MEKASMLIKKFLTFVLAVFPIMNLTSVETRTEPYSEAMTMKDKKNPYIRCWNCWFYIGLLVKTARFFSNYYRKTPLCERRRI